MNMQNIVTLESVELLVLGSFCMEIFYYWLLQLREKIMTLVSSFWNFSSKSRHTKKMFHDGCFILWGYMTSKVHVDISQFFM